MENISPQKEKEEELYLTDYMKKELKGSSNWAMFLSISMILFFISYFFSILSSISSGLPLVGTTGGLIGVILFLAFLSLILGMGIVLFIFSSNLKKALSQESSISLNRSFHSLTRYFILSFIIIIVTILFLLIFTIFIF